MRREHIALVLVQSALAAPSFAQVEQSWLAFHGDVRTDNALAAAIDAQGEVYVTGYTFQHPTGLPMKFDFADIETVKYSALGVEQWSRRFSAPTPGTDIGSAIALGPQGTIYVAGSSRESWTASTSQMVVLAYDPLGSLVGQRLVGTPSALGNAAFALAIAADGSVYIGGQEDVGGARMCVFKCDPSLALQWKVTFSGPNGNELGVVNDLALDGTGAVVAVGRSGSAGNDNLAVMKVDSSGVLQWEREIDGPIERADEGVSIVVDAANDVYVAGSETVAAHFTNFLLASFDSAGNLRWKKSYDGAVHGDDYAREIALDPFGRVIATGVWRGINSGNNFVTYAHDSTGNLLWQNLWHSPGGSTDDRAVGLVLDEQGNTFVTGTRPLGTSATNIVVVAYDPTGRERWVLDRVTPPLTGGEGVNDIAVDARGAIVVAGIGHLYVGDMLVARFQRTSRAFCFGDGSGTACPCGNASPPMQQAGCLHSLGLGGRLIESGASNLSNDTLILDGVDMPDASALYFQGAASVSQGAGERFGDGLRCAGGRLVRLATKTNLSGASRYPETGEASVSARGLVSAPSTRTYQIWFRDAGSFCTSATFNLTNGVLVTWIP